MQLFFIIIQVIITVCLIAIILIQRSSSDGISGLSGGGSNGLMSARGSANFLTRATAVLAILFMCNSLILANIAGKHQQHLISDKLDTEVKTTTTKTIPTPPSDGGTTVPELPDNNLSRF